jgi:ABC-type glycerol-3-phosphate transport system substrate-binding protein/sugar lactone lactonase YvrE
MRTSKFVKTITLILTLVMLFTLFSACGEDKENNGDGADNGDTASGTIYVPEYITLEGEFEYMGNTAYGNNAIYFVADVMGEEITETDPATGESWTYNDYRQGLFRVNIDGTGFAELPEFEPMPIPEGSEGDVYINNLIVDAEGNLWVAETGNFYHYEQTGDGNTDSSGDGAVIGGGGGIVYSADGAFATTAEMPASSSDYVDPRGTYVDDGSVVTVRKLDADGKELLSVDLSEMQEGKEYFYIGGMALDAKGNLYVSDGDRTVYVMDATGAVQFKVEVQDWINQVIALGDGRVGVTAYEGSGMVIKPIDYAAKAWGQNIELPYNVWNVYPGDSQYTVYCGDGSNFYGYDPDKGETTKLFNFINCDVDNNNLNATVPLPDGRILCVSSTWNEDGRDNEIIILTPKPASEVVQKEKITYACMYMDYNIRGKIIEFNKTNPQYRIEVQDYSEYNTNDDYTAGLTKLTTEILTGKVPDIMDVNSLPVKQYAAKGLLEDLWPYIEADTELGGRDALLDHVFDVLETDGKLYQVSPSFSVMTCVGNPQLVGDQMGWTVDEMYEALAKLPEGAQVFNEQMTRDIILQYCLYLGMDEYVDWNEGKCNFNSEGFVKLLEFANSFPAEFDYENYDWENAESEYSRIKNGKQLLSLFSASDFENFQMYKAMFGGDITFIGFPTESRNGSAYQIDSGLAMSSKCQHKDGAWEFLRTFLTEEYQKENTWWGFPTNKAAFDAKLAEAMKVEYQTDENGDFVLDENGEKIEISKGTWGWDELEVEIHAITQEEADQIMELINNTNVTFNYDEKMYNVIVEEAGAYFSGQKSAKDVADIIQNRLTTYVNEQR